MAVAYYGVLAYLDWQTPANVKQGWEAAATDPMLLKAFALIGVELMLVTALALFFSTFSSTFLSAALTIAIYVIGHFSDDLRTLESFGASPAVAMIGRGLYYAFPNLAPLNVTAAVVHGQAVTAQHMLLASGSIGLYVGRFAGCVHADLRTPGLQVDGDTSPKPPRPALDRVRRPAGRSDRHADRDQRGVRTLHPDTRGAVGPVAGTHAPARSRLQQRCCGHLLDPRRPVLRKHEALKG